MTFSRNWGAGTAMAVTLLGATAAKAEPMAPEPPPPVAPWYEAIEFEAELTSEACDTPLYALGLPRNALVACIIREGTVLIPSGKTTIQAGDHVVIVALRSAVPEVERLLRRRNETG